MIKIIPAILSKTKKDFLKRLDMVKDFKTIQVDVMDGKFVKNKSVPIKSIPKLKNAEAHLMVKYPLKYIDDLFKKGFKKVIVHYEADNFDDAIIKIKEKKMIPAIAINPKTSVAKIKPFLKSVKSVTVLTVNPGFYGSRFLPSQLKKIKELIKLKVKVEVDGGIDDKTAPLVVKAGADILVSGSFLFKHGPKQGVKLIKNSLK